MQTDESKLSTEHLINLIIGLVGAILVLVGVIVVRKETASTVIISIGASMIASAIVAYLSSIYIQKYRRAKEISEIWGIRSVEDKRTIMNVRVDECIEKASHHYDIMAFGLKSLRDGNPQGVREMLKRGTIIRILSVSPDCKALNDRDNQEKKPEGSTALSIRQLKEWVDNLAEEYPGKIQVKLAHYLPGEFYCRVDGAIFVGPYQYGKDSQQVITMEFKNPGKAFSYYEAYFELLWNDSEYCS